MIHYTCDGCQRLLNLDHDLRYVVKMEIYASVDPSDDELEDDRDHLQEIQDIIERLDDVESEEVGADVYQQMRFDLCAECRKRFLLNPIRRGAATQLNFSEN